MNNNPSKLKRLTKSLTIYGSIVITLVIILLITNFFGNSFLSSKADELSNIQLQISEVENKSITQEQKILELHRAKKVWQKIEQLRNSRNSLDFDKIKTIINTINQDRWLIKKIEINISPPIDKNFSGFQQVILTKSDIDITFSTLSDQVLFNVIDKINDNFPGFINYKSFKIKRNGEINREVLDKLSKGVLPELIECKLSFEWQNLKDIRNDK